MDAVTENIMEPKDLIFLWDIPAIIVVYILLKRAANTGIRRLDRYETTYR